MLGDSSAGAGGDACFCKDAGGDVPSILLVRARGR